VATYTYFCEDCLCQFTEQMSMSEYVANPSCPFCNESYHVYRDFRADEFFVIPPQHTLGSLADRNTATKSNDEKVALYNKHNAYKLGETSETHS